MNLYGVFGFLGSQFQPHGSTMGVEIRQMGEFLAPVRINRNGQFVFVFWESVMREMNSFLLDVAGAPAMDVGRRRLGP